MNGPIGLRDLGADSGWKRAAAVAPAHGGKKAARLLERQITAGRGHDVAHVGRDDCAFGHGSLQFAKRAARTERAGRSTIRPFLQLAGPCILEPLHPWHTVVARCVTADLVIDRPELLEDTPD